MATCTLDGHPLVACDPSKAYLKYVGDTEGTTHGCSGCGALYSVGVRQELVTLPIPPTSEMWRESCWTVTLLASLDRAGGALYYHGRQCTICRGIWIGDANLMASRVGAIPRTCTCSGEKPSTTPERGTWRNEHWFSPSAERLRSKCTLYSFRWSHGEMRMPCIGHIQASTWKETSDYESTLVMDGVVWATLTCTHCGVAHPFVVKRYLEACRRARGCFRCGRTLKELLPDHGRDLACTSASRFLCVGCGLVLGDADGSQSVTGYERTACGNCCGTSGWNLVLQRYTSPVLVGVSTLQRSCKACKVPHAMDRRPAKLLGYQTDYSVCPRCRNTSRYTRMGQEGPILVSVAECDECQLGTLGEACLWRGMGDACEGCGQHDWRTGVALHALTALTFRYCACGLLLPRDRALIHRLYQHLPEQTYTRGVCATCDASQPPGSRRILNGVVTCVSCIERGVLCQPASRVPLDAPIPVRPVQMPEPYPAPAQQSKVAAKAQRKLLAAVAKDKKEQAIEREVQRRIDAEVLKRLAEVSMVRSLAGGPIPVSRAHLPPDAPSDVPHSAVAVLKAASEVPRAGDCIVCMERPANAVLLECGHLGLCVGCAERHVGKECPACRARVARFVRCYQL
jgi:hypothetical protein